MISTFFKAIRKLFFWIKQPIYNSIAKIYLILNGAKLSKNLKVNGFIQVFVTRRGILEIGENLIINSGKNYNIIGRQQYTTFWVEGKLTIGNNVGMSSTAIICNYEIEIGDYTTIGGNTVIYDTDFHSLDPNIRKNKKMDKKQANFGKVIIKKNSFIGAHTTILKGVTIGENSIIGACSVVTKDIPNNQIWAGNPAVFIKNI